MLDTLILSSPHLLIFLGYTKPPFRVVFLHCISLPVDAFFLRFDFCVLQVPYTEHAHRGVKAREREFTVSLGTMTTKEPRNR